MKEELRSSDIELQALAHSNLGLAVPLIGHIRKDLASSRIV